MALPWIYEIYKAVVGGGGGVVTDLEWTDART